MSETNTDAKANANTAKPRFEIQKVYLRDVSLESPKAVEVFRGGAWKPEANLQLNSRSKKVDDTLHEVILTVTVTVKHDDANAYLVEVQQAGLFTLEGIPEQHVGQILGAACPAVLFPFAREVVADLVQKAGFPQHLLPPVNFDALYLQQKQREAGSESAEPAAAVTH